jgi:rhamnosyltransferase
VGDFRDEFFIDYVDTEYCLRLKEYGYKVIIAPKIIMKHPLGYYKPSTIFEFLFGQPVVSNYPAFRCYYWTRNGIIVSLEQLCKNFKWSIGQLYYLLVRRLFMVIFFEDDKLKKLTNIFKGILHALTLKTGKVKTGIQ